MRTNAIWPSSDHGRAPEPEFTAAAPAANGLSTLMSAIPKCSRIFTVPRFLADRNRRESARQELGDWRTRAFGQCLSAAGANIGRPRSLSQDRPVDAIHGRVLPQLSTMEVRLLNDRCLFGAAP